LAMARNITPSVRRNGLPAGVSLNATRMAFCAGGPAAWDLLPGGLSLGAGPTIFHAQGEVSKLDADVALVSAAGRGSAEEVRDLLVQASSPNVRAPVHGSASPVHGSAVPGHATTALHAAAAKGSLDVVQILLTGGADPRLRNNLRMLTPLHEAATVPVAEALLAARASPNSRDPREPDPAWYHRQRGRHDVALRIAAVANKIVPVSNLTQSETTPFQGSNTAKKKVFPSLSAAEIAAARLAWEVTNIASHPAILRANPAMCLHSTFPRAKRTTDELECPICMVEMSDTDRCIVLPCNIKDGVLSSTVKAIHAFHSACIERWWTKSCRCPTCRRDLRPLLASLPRSKERPRRPIAPRSAPNPVQFTLKNRELEFI